MDKYRSAALRLAEMIMDITDPEVPRWKKEQLEILARNAAGNYIRQAKESK